MKFEARLNEYEGLRQEVLQVLPDMSQLRMAVISASAVLLGICWCNETRPRRQCRENNPFHTFCPMQDSCGKNEQWP